LVRNPDDGVKAPENVPRDASGGLGTEIPELREHFIKPWRLLIPAEPHKCKIAVTMPSPPPCIAGRVRVEAPS
jgi:hypothetical protein